MPDDTRKNRADFLQRDWCYPNTTARPESVLLFDAAQVVLQRYALHLARGVSRMLYLTIKGGGSLYDGYYRMFAAGCACRGHALMKCC